MDALNQLDNEASRYDAEALEITEGIEATGRVLRKIEEVKSLMDRLQLNIKAAALRDNKATKRKQ